MVDRSHSFEAIPLPEDGYTVSYLKDVVQQAKNLYLTKSEGPLTCSTPFYYCKILCIYLLHIAPTKTFS